MLRYAVCYGGTCVIDNKQEDGREVVPQIVTNEDVYETLFGLKNSKWFVYWSYVAPGYVDPVNAQCKELVQLY